MKEKVKDCEVAKIMFVENYLEKILQELCRICSWNRIRRCVPVLKATE